MPHDSRGWIVVESSTLILWGGERKSEEVLPIVKEASTSGTKSVWLQEGIVNNAAAALAKQAGLLIVIDRCWLKDHTARSIRG